MGTRTITAIISGFSLLLFALPAGAQPTTSNTQPSPSTVAPQGSGSVGMMGRMGMATDGQRGVGMGMMMGPPQGAGDEDDRGPGPMHRWHDPEGHGTPMQIIINIGPDNRVETEEHAWRGGGPSRRERPMMGGEWRGRWMAERVDAGLSYIHDQLHVTSEQQPAWDRFATTVRQAVPRIRHSPAGEAPEQTLEQRLAAHEAMLNSRLEAIRAVRSALSDLTGSLTDAQKHTLDEDTAAFMARETRMRAGWQ
jgi:hypothetical protein